MKLVWSEKSKTDMRKIYDFLAEQYEPNAQKYIGKIIAKAENILPFPHAPRMIPELGNQNYREVLLDSFRIQYEVTSDTVYVVQIVSARQRLRERGLRQSFRDKDSR